MSESHLDAEALNEHATRTRLASIRTACSELAQQIAAANQQQNRSERAESWHQALHGYAWLVLWLRRHLTLQWQLGTLVVVFFSAGAISFVIGAILKLPTIGFVGCWLLLAISAFAYYAHILIFPATEYLEASRARHIELAKQRRAEIAAVTAQIAELQKVLTDTQTEEQDLLRQLEDRRQHLLKTDWRALKQAPFEAYLRDVFESLGYQVIQAKVEDDRGVDLIVVRDGRRVAIVAKTGSSVDRPTIEAVHAGMEIFQCQGCAVISNNTFSSGARAVAQKLSCVLIDHTQFRSFILGLVEL